MQDSPGRGYPKVTGVLPVALERMTRAVGNVVHSDKEYVCVMQLHEAVDEERLKKVLKEFEGTIYQRPPLRSSVKRSLRRKRVFSVNLLEYTGKYALLHIWAEAGTYMRKICWDAGLILGTGSHMRELRRIRTGPFSESRSLVTMHDVAYAVIRYREEGSEDLLRKCVLPGEYSVCHIPKVAVRDSAVESIVHGAMLAVPGVSMLQEGIRRGDWVAMLTLKGELIGLARAEMSTEEVLTAEKGIAFRPVRVIMEPGLYPKMWGSKKAGEAAGAGV